MTEKSPSLDLLERLQAAGVPKNIIAQILLIAPSGVTDLYKGRRTLKHDEAAKLLPLLPRARQGREIPVIGMAGAGNWIEAIEHTEEKAWLPEQAGDRGKFAVRVVGQSMNLLLPEGSLAVVDPDDRELFVGKLYLLMNGDGEGTIKRYRADPARFEPVSDDPKFEPFSIANFDFRIIGRVTSGLQNF
ncbi:LexA family protein [Sphingomonas lacusdianchii]|uniref:LexA family protein n=1 Tax=Sphingomonas lacusdianchii TaxID=2917992 RepID=UPI001F5A6834|nr:S24 family peptidase [Sphingomonas sp. JXJ CY 53]